MKDTRKVVLWQDVMMRGTDRAHLFRTFPRHDNNSVEIWIPRSIIHHISRDPVRPEDAEQRCTVEVEEWFCEKEGL